jgi:diaminohydroxyphosphoribosylaminopyrimidine deaminase/5-amino-6-(5-phosphoribosylamino)uracil reductase
VNSDEKYMQRCLDLAIKGAGYVAPNPLVGSVIVQDGKIIGEGYHQCYGEAHAEVNAVASVQNKSLLKNSTIYVNLEPCAHFGKTPPCADLIVEAGIPTVVIGTIDPFASVAGKGIEKLKKAGIQVKVNILKEACLELNKRFFTFHQKKRPYIILKWAQSRDGFMDMNRQNNEKGTFWITAPATKTLVHKWRHEEAGILVGKNTIKTDDPALTCRVYQGQSPIRLIIDQKMRLDYSAFKVGDRSVQTYILTEKEVQSAGKLQFIQPTQFDLGGILDTLYRLDIQSILVEGGPTTLGRFIEENCWDEARILTGETTLNEGLAAPSLPLQKTLHKAFKFGVDTVQIYRHD